MAVEMSTLVLGTLLAVLLLDTGVHCTLYRLYTEQGYGIDNTDAELYYVRSAIQCGMLAATSSRGVFSASQGPGNQLKCLVAPPNFRPENLTDGAAQAGELVFTGDVPSPPTDAAATNGPCLTEADINCADVEVGRTFLHPTDCGKFLRCEAGRTNPTVMWCSATTFYYLSSSMCDYKKDDEDCNCQTTY